MSLLPVLVSSSNAGLPLLPLHHHHSDGLRSRMERGICWPYWMSVRCGHPIASARLISSSVVIRYDSHTLVFLFLFPSFCQRRRRRRREGGTVLPVTRQCDPHEKNTPCLFF